MDKLRFTLMISVSVSVCAIVVSLRSKSGMDRSPSLRISEAKMQEVFACFAEFSDSKGNTVQDKTGQNRYNTDRHATVESRGVMIAI